MGYGLPAAIAAALRHRGREVFAFAGDGCFQMTGMEFGVAVEHGLKIRSVVCDNGIYGTIRMHQEREFPGRVEATNMRNPDFAAWARSYGAQAFTVESDAEFPECARGGARRWKVPRSSTSSSIRGTSPRGGRSTRSVKKPDDLPPRLLYKRARAHYRAGPL